jgi:general secretion pathway protein C
MKHPFWIVNLGLLSVLLCVLLFITLSRITVPGRKSIDPTYYAPQKEHKVAINIQKIFENDLFGTYIKELPKLHNLDLIIPFPAPPVPQKIVAPKIIEPEFLDPVHISLMGIIVVGSNDTKNRAIIQDDKTKQENTYKVGDIIQDAQIIRIFKNKIILLRLNGQQEILYLREQDAKSDILYSNEREWDNVIRKINDFNYLISPENFVDQVHTISQFIEMLNTTTAYQQGKSIGLRIGQLTQQSLGIAMGLQKGDIVTHVNSIPTETTDERLAIYKNIISLPLDHTITIRLIRKNREIIISYTLNNFIKPHQDLSPLPAQKQQQAFLFHQDHLNNKKQHYAFAPTVNKIRDIDHKSIVRKGSLAMDIAS